MKRKKVEDEVNIEYKEKNQDTTVFDTVQGLQRKSLLQVLNHDKDLAGSLFQHTWYCNTSRTDSVWKARILKWKGKAHQSIIVSYWNNDDDEHDAEDWDVKAVDILSDIVTGDVIFEN